ncbi:hypothetical protein [Pseudomonas viridiflava]|uniref:hypothetical protein n=1 Tax=Pseudomonas viridiflava TaxID=33069 RepID=UPI000F03D2CE|nr:hypothetical protein [Pseudomonas viridiflava]
MTDPIGKAEVGRVEGSTAFSMTKIFEVLSDDIELVYPRTPLENGMARYPNPVILSQGKRRALIRAIFAFVEGMSYSQRVALLHRYSYKLAPHVAMALKEKQIEITNGGKVRTKSIKSSLMSLVRLTIEQYVECYQGELSLSCSGSGFEGLVSSVQVRDRLMHPRSEHDLFVKDDEILRAVRGWVWFSQIYADMLVAEFEDLRRLAITRGNIEALEGEQHQKVLQIVEFIKEKRSI